MDGWMDQFRVSPVMQLTYWGSQHLMHWCCSYSRPHHRQGCCAQQTDLVFPVQCIVAVSSVQSTVQIPVGLHHLHLLPLHGYCSYKFFNATEIHHQFLCLIDLKLQVVFHPPCNNVLHQTSVLCFISISNAAPQWRTRHSTSAEGGGEICGRKNEDMNKEQMNKKRKGSEKEKEERKKHIE